MDYDFETVVDRSGSGSVKWDMMLQADSGVPKGIVPLSIGDMELKTPPELVAGLKQYLENAILGYTAPTGEYLRTVADWFRLRHGWDIRKDWIVGFDGVVPALYAAVNAFTRPGEGVIYMPPVYRPMYAAIADTGRRPVSVPLLLGEGGYGIDFDGMERAAADPGVSMLLFCSPHNPVSRVWRFDELERLGRICLEHNVLVVSDEIHMDFTMPGHAHVAFPLISSRFADRCVVCTAPSKTFNIAGLQVSNIIIANQELRRRFQDVYRTGGRFGVNQLGLEACRLAYAHCEHWLDAVTGHIHRNGETVRRFMAKHFPEIWVFDHEGTYFLWLDFRAWGLSAEALEKRMIGEARLFLDEGHVFGPEGAGFERVNLACPAAVLDDALERLRRAGRPGPVR